MYNIVIVSDETYIQHAAVMLCSLFEKNLDSIFNIYLLTDGIKSMTKNKLEEFVRQYKSKITTIEPEKLIQDNTFNLESLPSGQWNKIIYYKLLMPYILPDNIDRCLFLDVDMIINDRIDVLYNWELNNMAIAAAEDIPDCIEHKVRLGLKQEDVYINSGVMVCNLDEWRRMSTSKDILSHLNEISHNIMNEQDFIAKYFTGKIKLLPIRWNMTTFYFMRVPKIFDKYLPELQESKKNPGIIHFACPIKPWFKDCTHPYRKLYRCYLHKTPWKKYDFSYGEKLTKRQRINKYIKNHLEQIGMIKTPMFTPKL